MTIQLSNPPSLHTPSGYSHLAMLTGGELILLAGQVPLDAQGGLVGKDDFAAQTEQVFRNLLGALEAVGAGPGNLAKLTTFVTDASNLSAFRQVRDRFLDPAHLPASTLVQIGRLARPEFLVEIEAIALR